MTGTPCQAWCLLPTTHSFHPWHSPSTLLTAFLATTPTCNPPSCLTTTPILLPSCLPTLQDKLDQVQAEDCRTEVLRQVKAQVRGWGLIDGELGRRVVHELCRKPSAGTVCIPPSALHCCECCHMTSTLTTASPLYRPLITGPRPQGAAPAPQMCSASAKTWSPAAAAPTPACGSTWRSSGAGALKGRGQGP